MERKACFFLKLFCLIDDQRAGRKKELLQLCKHGYRSDAILQYEYRQGIGI